MTVPPFVNSFPMPKIFQQSLDIVSFPGHAPTGHTITGNFQPTTYAPARMRTDALPAEYFGPTMYVLYTDVMDDDPDPDQWMIPAKGPWGKWHLKKGDMFYKIVVIREFANHYQILLDEQRNG